MVQVRGATVRSLRQQAGLSERALAAMLEPERADAVRQYLRRLEEREATDVDPEFAEHLAEALGADVAGMGADDHYYLWVLMSPSGLLDLGGYAVAFSDAQTASDRRSALAHLGLNPATFAVAPIKRDELIDILAENVGPDLAEGNLALDFADERFQALVVLEGVLRKPEMYVEKDGGLAPVAATLIRAGLDLMAITDRQERRVETLARMYPDSPRYGVHQLRLKHLLALIAARVEKHAKAFTPPEEERPPEQ